VFHAGMSWLATSGSSRNDSVRRPADLALLQPVLYEQARGLRSCRPHLKAIICQEVCSCRDRERNYKHLVLFDSFGRLCRNCTTLFLTCHTLVGLYSFWISQWCPNNCSLHQRPMPWQSLDAFCWSRCRECNKQSVCGLLACAVSGRGPLWYFTHAHASTILGGCHSASAVHRTKDPAVAGRVWRC